MTMHYPARRSERVPLAIAITVIRKGFGDDSFKEESRTLNVSKYGGLIATSYKLERGTHILIENPALSRVEVARVVWVREGRFNGSQFEAGLEVEEGASIWPLVQAEPPVTPKEYTVAKPILKQEPVASLANISRTKDVAAIESGGGEFVGVQPGTPGSLPDQYLFNDPKSGSTLAIGTGEVTSAAVRAKILASRTELEVLKSIEEPCHLNDLPKKAASSDR